MAIRWFSVMDELLEIYSVSLAERILSHVYDGQFAKVGFCLLVLHETGLQGLAVELVVALDGY